jgi:hypothetical protein
MSEGNAGQGGEGGRPNVTTERTSSLTLLETTSVRNPTAVREIPASLALIFPDNISSTTSPSPTITLYHSQANDTGADFNATVAYHEEDGAFIVNGNATFVSGSQVGTGQIPTAVLALGGDITVTCSVTFNAVTENYAAAFTVSDEFDQGGGQTPPGFSVRMFAGTVAEARSGRATIGGNVPVGIWLVGITATVVNTGVQPSIVLVFGTPSPRIRRIRVRYVRKNTGVAFNLHEFEVPAGSLIHVEPVPLAVVSAANRPYFVQVNVKYQKLVERGTIRVKNP